MSQETNEPITYGDLLKDKDFVASTRVEMLLYGLLMKCGLKEEDIIAGEKYDKQIGEIKEGIYKEFSKLLGFEYYWESYYHIKKK